MTDDASAPRIMYPYAYNSEREIVHVSDAEFGRPYSCVGCGMRMVPHMGNVVEHHFAHYGEERCDPDHTLHEAAKSHIKECILGVFDSYKMLVPIPCRLRHGGRFDLLDGVADVRLEATIVSNTRSDLVTFNNNGEPLAIIEVVVSHAMALATHAAYRAAGMPVVTVHPTWDDLSGMQSCTIENVECPLCFKMAADIYKHMPGLVAERPKERIMPRLYAGHSRAGVEKSCGDVLRACEFIPMPNHGVYEYAGGSWILIARLVTYKAQPSNSDAEFRCDIELEILRIWEKQNPDPPCPDCARCILDAAVKRLGEYGMRTNMADLRHSCMERGASP